MIVKIPFCHLKAMSSDLLKGEVRLSFEFALNAETMQLREKLAMLEILGTPVDLEIKSPQGTLAGFQSPLPDSPNNISDDGREGLSSEEFAEGFEKAATMVYDAGARANEPGFVGDVMETVIDELKQKRKEIKEIGNGRKGRGGTVTISHGDKSVTMTNEQFSKAAQRIKQESRAAVAHHKKTKSKR